MDPLEEPRVIWWRFGKEDEGGDFRVNPPHVVDEHLDSKLQRGRGTTTWQWHDPGKIILETPAPSLHYGNDTRIYYLIEQGLTVIRAIHLAPPHDDWYWYIHLADIYYDSARSCWVNQDLFCDLLVDRSGQSYQLLDLADLGKALEIGLVDSAKTAAILRRTDTLLNTIGQGQFPWHKF